MRYNILTNDNQGYGNNAASSYGEICIYASPDKTVTDAENKSHHFSARSFKGLHIYNNTIRYINSGVEAPTDIPYAAVNFYYYNAQTAGATNFFKNNIVMSNRRFIYLPPNIASDYNLYYNIGDGKFASCWNYNGTDYSTLAAYSSASGNEKHSKNQDPMLSNSAYHSVGMPLSQFAPQAGSPVIDAGTDVGNMDTRDFKGSTIPQNGKYDIGACEYVSGATPMPSPTPHPMPVTVPTRNMSAIVQNGSFEDDNAVGANRPLGWDVYNNFGNADACYTYSGSGGHTGSYFVKMTKSTPYQIDLFQEITGIPNGRYTLTAYVQAGGTFNAGGCSMFASKFGERVPQLSTPINTKSGSWPMYQIQNINVTNNRCTIGFWVDARAGAWINLDDVTMTRVDDGTVNLAANCGFEADGIATNTPAGWTASGANPEASYTQSGNTYMGNYKLVQWKATNYTVLTSQTKNNIPNGNYDLYANISSGGGQADCHMEASNYGGKLIKYDIPGTNGEWMPICIRNIHVSNNSITFGFYSNASANQWLNVDEVVLMPRNLMAFPGKNLGFEADGAATKTPYGWNIGGTNPNAVFVTNNGMAHEGSYYLLHQLNSAWNVSTYQSFSDLFTSTPDGGNYAWPYTYYTMTAWVMTPRGMPNTVAKMYITTYDDSGVPTEYLHLINSTDGFWRKIVISNVNITGKNGKVNIGFKSKGRNSSDWLCVDDIEFYQVR
jgi:hypothetical protein